MDSITHNGKTVGFRRLPDGQRFIQARHRIGKHDLCPLYNVAFAPENTTAVILIISNQAGVPNRFCHEECLADKTLEYAFHEIAEDWEAAKAAGEQFAGWQSG